MITYEIHSPNGLEDTVSSKEKAIKLAWKYAKECPNVLEYTIKKVFHSEKIIYKTGRWGQKEVKIQQLEERDTKN